MYVFRPLNYLNELPVNVIQIFHIINTHKISINLTSFNCHVQMQKNNLTFQRKQYNILQHTKKKKIILITDT